MTSSKVSFGKTGYIYFTGYNNDENDYKIKPLYVRLPKIFEYVKSFHETKLKK